jgi:probable HAF family extracellular repeat protein
MRSREYSRLFALGIAFAGLAALLATVGSASSKPAGWRMVDLGTLGGRVAYASSADAINARGDVIGNSWNRSQSRTRAFLWRGGRLIPLGTLGGGSSRANAINDRGQIVGWAETSSGKMHAFLWKNGHMRDLGVPGDTDMSEAVRIANSGLVVGVASRSVKGLATWPALRGHLVVWQRDGRIRDLGRPWNPSRDAATLVGAVDAHGRIVGRTAYDYLGTDGRVFLDRSFLWDGRNLRSLPPRSARSEALDINDVGQIIGWTYRDPDFRAVTWERSQMRLLPLPPGLKGAFARAINDKGEIVGYGWADRDEDNHGVLWRIGTVIDLGTLGGAQSEAVAINNRRQIVGTSETAISDGEHAFLWQDGRMVDLGSGYPAAINDRGQIIGDSGYGGHALVWLPD